MKREPTHPTTTDPLARRHGHAARVARLALSPDEAAAALGCSRTFFDEHVAPALRMARAGRRRFVPVRELERWLDEHATRAIEGR